MLMNTLKQTKKWSRLGSAMMTTVFAAGTLAPSWAWAANDNCSLKPNKMQAVVGIGRTGQEKLALLAYEAERRRINEDLADISNKEDPAKGIKKGELEEFGAEPALCSKEVIRKNFGDPKNGYRLDPAKKKEAMEKCFGFMPTTWWPKSPSDPRYKDEAWDDYMEPLRFKFKKFSIQMAPQKEPKISCAKNVCEIEAGIDDLKMNFDLDVRSVNDKCTMLGLRNATASWSKPAKPAVSSGAKRKSVAKRTPGPAEPDSIKLKVKFRYTDNLARPIEIIEEGTSLDVPFAGIDLDAESASKNEKGVCEIAKGKPGKKNDPGLIGTSEALTQAEVAKNPRTMSEIFEAVRKTMVVELSNKLIEEVSRANGFGQNKEVHSVIFSLKDMTDADAMTEATQQGVKAVDQYLEKIRNARTSSELKRVSVADKLPAITEDFMRNFKGTDSTESIAMVHQVAAKWQQAGKIIEAMAKLSPDVPASTEARTYHSVLLHESQAIQEAVQNLSKIARNVQIEIDQDAEPVELMVAALQANELGQDIEFKLNACFKCRAYQIQDPTGGTFGFENKGDLRARTGWGTFNQMLAYLKDSHNLDTCIVEGKRACTNIQPGDEATQLHFNYPPVVSYGGNGQMKVVIRQVELDNQNNDLSTIASHMKLDLTLYGSLKPIEGGKKVQFKPDPDRIQVANTDFNTGDWGWAVTRIAEAVSDTGFSHRKIKDALTKSFGLPGGVTLADIQTKPTGFDLYMNLPDDPRTLLPATEMRNPAEARR